MSCNSTANRNPYQMRALPVLSEESARAFEVHELVGVIGDQGFCIIATERTPHMEQRAVPRPFISHPRPSAKGKRSVRTISLRGTR